MKLWSQVFRSPAGPATLSVTAGGSQTQASRCCSRVVGNCKNCTMPVVCNHWLAPDHAWIGVVRTAPGCSMHTNHFACDGYCRQPGAAGMDGADGKMAIRDRGYGCWFYSVWNASYASSAAVNVGRSLRVHTRCAVSALLDMHPNRSASDALCVHEDRLWCERARARGYDSIQIFRGTYYDSSGKRRAFAEIALCVDSCMRQAFAASACVPQVARRVMSNGEVQAGEGSCDCPSNAISLSCDGNHRVPPLLDPHGCHAAFRWIDGLHDRPDRIIGTRALQAAVDTQCRLNATILTGPGPLPLSAATSSSSSSA